MKNLTFALALILTASASVQAADQCAAVHRLRPSEMSYQEAKQEIKRTRSYADRKGGLVQLTGKDLVVGQTVFPHRTPADPVVFTDKKTGEVHVYGTQVDGTGFSYLKYKSLNDLLRGAPGEIIAKDVYLPNGQLARGKEAIWDTYRLTYEALKQVFPESVLEQTYRSLGLDPGSDIHFGGLALQNDGQLGRWTTDNWRRRIHAIGQVGGKLQILENPVFNKVSPEASEKDYPGFGLLPFLPGNYIGHAYGPNFKMVRNKEGKLELWMINEEVTRRVDEAKGPAEVTEIVARRMISPVEASDEKVVLLTVNGPDGKPHPDSDRGKEMSYTKLIEGFRPMSLTEEGFRITQRAVKKNGKIVYVEDPSLAKDEYFLMTGSSGNFAGDDYDARVAYRKGNAIGEYQMMFDQNGKSWKGFLKELKKKYRLSWAGRGTFVKMNGKWWLVFHAADKDLKPDGSYGGVIPPNTHEYHRNLYAVPVEFFINVNGKPDMRVLWD